MPEVIFKDLGIIDYKKAWDYQEALFNQTVNIKFENRAFPQHLQIKTKNHLLFCEHPHVYTLGKSGKPGHLLIDEAKLKELNATYYKINRGGDITYHGPGQLIGYPILDLDNFFTDIHKYLRYLEEVFIRVLADYNLEGQRSGGETGVWLNVGKSDARKILALGVKTNRWVTMHGWAFNVNTDLSYFNKIVPCGIFGKGVTSLEREIGEKIPVDAVKEKARKYFEEIFNANLVD